MLPTRLVYGSGHLAAMVFGPALSAFVHDPFFDAATNKQDKTRLILDHVDFFRIGYNVLLPVAFLANVS